MSKEVYNSSTIKVYAVSCHFSEDFILRPDIILHMDDQNQHGCCM